MKFSYLLAPSRREEPFWERWRSRRPQSKTGTERADTLNLFNKRSLRRIAPPLNPQGSLTNRQIRAPRELSPQ
jgi:hypothetical protein